MVFLKFTAYYFLICQTNQLYSQDSQSSLKSRAQRSMFDLFSFRAIWVVLLFYSFSVKFFLLTQLPIIQYLNLIMHKVYNKIVTMPPKKKNSKKEKGEKFGKIVFHDNLPLQYRQIVNELAKRINLNGFRWELVNGLFQKYSITDLFKFTKQININHLGLDGNHCESIIQQICVLKSFPKLANLFLGQNDIVSIEQLEYLHAPQLWRINLRNNMIRNLKPLRKTNFPKLVMLVIGKNQISELHDISKCHYPILGWIDLEENKLLTHVTECIKVKSETVNQFYAQDSSIIQNKELRKVFKKKWVQIQDDSMKWIYLVEQQ